MQPTDTDSGDSKTSVVVDREIDAPASLVWELVADVRRMGDWSPEAVAHTWMGGADGPAVGARFRGRNRNGFRRWSTVAEIVECEPGRSFVFDVRSLGMKVARWGYRLTPSADDQSCTVTESWSEQRGRTITALGLVATGVSDRATHNRASMEATLAALAQEAERIAAEG